MARTKKLEREQDLFAENQKLGIFVYISEFGYVVKIIGDAFASADTADEASRWLQQVFGFTDQEIEDTD